MMSRAVTLFLVVTTTVSGRIIPTRTHPHDMVLMPSFSSDWGLPHPVPVAEPCEPALIPEVPMKIPVAMPAIPEIAEPCLDEVIIPEISRAVPHPPALPTFVMPELPRVEVPIPEPCLEENLISAAPVFVPETRVVEIPAPPALPPMEMPALPEITVKAEPCLDEVVIPEIPFQPVAVPQAPELPAFVMPEMPVRIETPMPEPCLDDQLIPIAPMPEYIPVPAPMPLPIVPQAPELPAFVMPELPVRIETPIAEPCLDEEVIPIAPIPEYIPPEPMSLPVVPQAPELPAFVMPELPVRVEVAEPYLEEQLVPVAPIPEYIPSAPMPVPIVPQAPELPAFVMPELPVRVEVPIAEPCLEEQIIPVAPVPEYIPPAPMPLPVLPQAPELPSFVMPELPVRVEVPIAEPCLEEQLVPIAPIPEYMPPAPVSLPVVPHAPELPAFNMPELPVRMEVAMPEPCLEDVPIPVPMPLPIEPAFVPEKPVFVPMEPLKKLEDPCIIEDVAVVVPQQPKLPKPIAMPVMPYPGLIAADPCEPVMKTADLPPYYVRELSHKPILPMHMPTGYYNHLPAMGALHHVRNF